MSHSELTVREVMERQPVQLPNTATIQDALSLMNQRRIGSVLILDAQGTLCGIFTERDLLRRVATATPGWRDYSINAWMTHDPHTIHPDLSWEEAVNQMQKYRVRHLPVIESGQVVGLISNRLLMSRRDEVLSSRIESRTRELRAAIEQLMARDAEQNYNLQTAGRLQARMLLPQQPPPWPELRWAVHFAPLDHLGGDHYDFSLPAQDQLGLLIADASGHSIAAAMVAMFTRFCFVEASRSVSPGAVLSQMNERLQELSEERFVTAFYGVLHRPTHEFVFASAGHPYPLHYQADSGTVGTLVASGFFLGIMPQEVYHEKSIRLQPGDKLCFYTDGLIEARNEIGELYGFDRLREAFLRLAKQPATGIVDGIMAEVRSFCGTASYTDDVTLVIAEYLPDGFTPSY